MRKFRELVISVGQRKPASEMPKERMESKNFTFGVGVLEAMRTRAYYVLEMS